MEVKTEGNVTLSISELDRLRTQIKELTKQRDELNKHSKEVKLDIKVTEKYSGYDTIDTYDNNWLLKREDRYSSPYTKKMIHSDKFRVLDASTNYVGLQDVIDDLRLDAEAKVTEKIGDLTRQINILNEKYQKLVTSNQEELTKVHKAYRVQMDKMGESYTTEVDKLKGTIKTLEGKTEDLSKDQRIYQLEQEITQLKLKKGFWSFLN